MLKELQSLGLNIVVQDKEGNEVDIRQNMTTTMSPLRATICPAKNVLLESELQDDYSVQDADEGFDNDLEEDAEPDAAELASIESEMFDE